MPLGRHTIREMHVRAVVRSIAIALVLVASMIAGPASTVGPAHAATSPSTPSANACKDPDVPDWFHDSLVTSIAISGDLHPSWADSPGVTRAICWQGSDFD